MAAPRDYALVHLPDRERHTTHGRLELPLLHAFPSPPPRRRSLARRDDVRHGNAERGDGRAGNGAGVARESSPHNLRPGPPPRTDGPAPPARLPRPGHAQPEPRADDHAVAATLRTQ